MGDVHQCNCGNQHSLRMEEPGSPDTERAHLQTVNRKRKDTNVQIHNTQIELTTACVIKVQHDGQQYIQHAFCCNKFIQRHRQQTVQTWFTVQNEKSTRSWLYQCKAAVLFYIPRGHPLPWKWHQMSFVDIFLWFSKLNISWVQTCKPYKM